MFPNVSSVINVISMKLKQSKINVCTYFVSIMSTFHLHKILFSFLFSATHNRALYF